MLLSSAIDRLVVLVNSNTVMTSNHISLDVARAKPGFHKSTDSAESAYIAGRQEV